MSLTDKVAALLIVLRREDVDAMPPAARERFAQLCQHWADFCTHRPQPKAGVLVELSAYRRES